MNQQALAQEMVKAVYDDQEMEINGRSYKFLKMKHKQRRRVFAFMTKVQSMIEAHDFSFMDWPEFEPVEKVMQESITYSDSLVSKIPEHWETYPEDYFHFTLTAMPVISYPFLAGSRTA